MKHKKKYKNPGIRFFLENQQNYLACIEPLIRFLQGKDPSLALRICSRKYLPEGPRFQAITEGASPEDPDPLSWAFGSLGVQDRAKYLSSLLLDDLVDIIREGVDERFELSRYAEKLAASMPTFDLIWDALISTGTLVDRYLDQLSVELIRKIPAPVVGITIPFPGNAYGAFRIAQAIKKENPEIKIILGGGYVNTELRQLSDPRVFDWVDFITLDDGEKPLLCILEHLQGKRSSQQLLRTFIRQKGQVVYQAGLGLHDIPQRDLGTPTYQGLSLDHYLSVFEMLNPMHRIWSDGRWNKLTLAHGCYWKKCNFCDVSLDYIGRYDPNSADLIVERMKTLIKETDQTGFHFVDEAAPPALLRALAQRLIEQKLSVSWWGNVRFDKVFTPELTDLLAQSGCIAVSGGLEVASDRLLKLMQKGVTVEQVARVTHALTRSGIMVHAYLMYGFPTQTIQETIDALERVRQLFEEGCIQSGFWHPFSATAHSPIGMNPGKFGIQLLPEPPGCFARNDLGFIDPTGCDHLTLGKGLKKALYNYMHGVGLDLDVRIWFDQKKIPSPQVSKTLIRRALNG